MKFKAFIFSNCARSSWGETVRPVAALCSWRLAPRTISRLRLSSNMPFWMRTSRKPTRQLSTSTQRLSSSSISKVRVYRAGVSQHHSWGAATGRVSSSTYLAWRYTPYWLKGLEVCSSTWAPWGSKRRRRTRHAPKRGASRSGHTRTRREACSSVSPKRGCTWKSAICRCPLHSSATLRVMPWRCQ